jgi:hypothetical protein
MTFRYHADEAFFAAGINQGAAANSIGCVEHSMAGMTMQQQTTTRIVLVATRIVLQELSCWGRAAICLRYE